MISFRGTLVVWDIMGGNNEAFVPPSAKAEGWGSCCSRALALNKDSAVPTCELPKTVEGGIPAGVKIFAEDGGGPAGVVEGFSP